jgi:hypothetical protein
LPGETEYWWASAFFSMATKSLRYPNLSAARSRHMTLTSIPREKKARDRQMTTVVSNCPFSCGSVRREGASSIRCGHARMCSKPRARSTVHRENASSDYNRQSSERYANFGICVALERRCPEGRGGWDLAQGKSPAALPCRSLFRTLREHGPSS